MDTALTEHEVREELKHISKSLDVRIVYFAGEWN
jgi:hypothetical protein